VHLVQLLLPLFDNQGAHHPDDVFRRIRTELTDRFGGLTAYSRAPASGLWQDETTSRTTRDDIVVYEVMVDSLDRAWWSQYRSTLERVFRQKELIVRAQAIELL
jgi:hypothetical protein